jgi:hypothetical protein
VKYLVTVTAVVEIDAENVAQAMREARRCVRVIGDRVGGHHGKHERESTRYAIAVREVQIGMPQRATE